jgi:hypothetical protein
LLPTASARRQYVGIKALICPWAAGATSKLNRLLLSDAVTAPNEDTFVPLRYEEAVEKFTTDSLNVMAQGIKDLFVGPDTVAAELSVDGATESCTIGVPEACTTGLPASSVSSEFAGTDTFTAPWERGVTVKLYCVPSELDVTAPKDETLSPVMYWEVVPNCFIFSPNVILHWIIELDLRW